MSDATLFDALITGNARKVMDELFPRSPQQPMPGTPALVEGLSPTADLGTAEVSDSCERCHGTKLVTLYGTYMGDADDQPCPECK
jgi:hypothetical protein